MPWQKPSNWHMGEQPPIYVKKKTLKAAERLEVVLVQSVHQRLKYTYGLCEQITTAVTEVLLG